MKKQWNYQEVKIIQVPAEYIEPPLVVLSNVPLLPTAHPVFILTNFTSASQLFAGEEIIDQFSPALQVRNI